MKTGFFVIVLFLLSYSSYAENNKKFLKKEIILTGVTLLNPALSVGTLISNANSLQKILSLGSLAYTTKEGKTITESAISLSLNEKCLVKKIFFIKKFCLKKTNS